MKLRKAFDLKGQIGRGPGEKPSGAVGAQCELRLGARLAGKFVLARILTHTNTVSAAAIPLRKPTPGRRTEDLNAHLAGLELCADVGVNFAAENNFFENRTDPSHNFHPRLEIFASPSPQARRGRGCKIITPLLIHAYGNVPDSRAPKGHSSLQGA